MWIRPLYDLHHQRYVVYWDFAVEIENFKNELHELRGL